MNTFKQDFHDRINELYEEARDRDHTIGRKLFAQMCGVRRGQMHGWLSRNGSPNVETLRKLAKTCNVSVSWLVGDTNVRCLTSPSIPAKLINFIERMPPEAINELCNYANYLFKKYQK